MNMSKDALQEADKVARCMFCRIFPIHTSVLVYALYGRADKLTEKRSIVDESFFRQPRNKDISFAVAWESSVLPIYQGQVNK